MTSQPIRWASGQQVTRFGMMTPAGLLEYNRLGITVRLRNPHGAGGHELHELTSERRRLTEHRPGLITNFQPLALKYEAPLVYSNGTRTCCS